MNNEWVMIIENKKQERNKKSRGNIQRNLLIAITSSNMSSRNNRKRPHFESSSLIASNNLHTISGATGDYTRGICDWDEDGEQSKQTSIRSFFGASLKQPVKRKCEAKLKSKTETSTNNETYRISPDTNTDTDRPTIPQDDHDIEYSRRKHRTTTAIIGTQKRNNHISTSLLFSSNKKDTTITTENRKEVKKEKTKSMTQVFLDCGQRSWGQILCKHCNMLYVPGVLEDMKAHQSMCGPIRDGLTWRIYDKSRIEKRISKNQTIIAVPSNKKSMPATYTRLIEIVSHELGMEYDDIILQKNGGAERGEGGSCYRSYYCKYGAGYLYISNSRVLGLILVEPLSLSTSGHHHNPSPAVLGIALLWVHAKARSQGVATQLVDTARARSIFGYVPCKQQIAFSSPTQAGLGFGRAYCGREPHIYSFNNNGSSNNNNATDVTVQHR